MLVVETRFVEPDEPLLESVVELADASRHLGYIPRGAFRGLAENKQVIAALTSDGGLAGFVLFRLVRRSCEVSVTQLVVAEQFRRRGVAARLIADLSAKTTQMRGISLLCRKDFDANRVWPRLGFEAVGEKPGRARLGSTLVKWWLDHNHGSLFTRRWQPGDALQVVVDACVFYYMFGDHAHDECRALLADWLAHDVDICYSPELNNEIQRGADKAKREQHRNNLPMLKRIHCDPGLFRTSLEQLLRALPVSSDTQTDSDYRHLAWAIAAGADAFVTRDGAILEHADMLDGKTAIEILRPEELLVRIDKLQDSTRYVRSRLHGTILVDKPTHPRVRAVDLQGLEDSSHGERGRDLLARVRKLHADPKHGNVRSVEGLDTGILGLLGLETSGSHIVRVSILRVKAQGHLSAATLADGLAQYLLRITATKMSSLTVVSDDHAPHECQVALLRAGFLPHGFDLLKAALPGIHSAETAHNELTMLFSHEPRLGDVRDHLVALLMLSSDGDRAAAIEIERTLWPIKLRDAALGCFVVPIRPRWAMELIDSRLSEQSLFGGDPRLLLSQENVYYRSATGPCPKPGDRVLWYVSQDRAYPGSGAIRAASTVDAADILSPRDAYRLGRRYGVYSFDDIAAVGSAKHAGRVMMIRFVRTEQFPIGLAYHHAAETLRGAGRGHMTFQTLLKISPAEYVALYSSARARLP